MTKRSTLLPALGIGAIGAAAGGLAGHYDSDKTNTTPATVLGALGGGAGATAGTAAALPVLDTIVDKRDQVGFLRDKLRVVDARMRDLKKKPLFSSKDFLDLQELKRNRRTLKKSLVLIPKWAHALHKHPGRGTALMLGGLGLNAAAVGALGAKLGIIGGDALA